MRFLHSSNPLTHPVNWARQITRSPRYGMFQLVVVSLGILPFVLTLPVAIQQPRTGLPMAVATAAICSFLIFLAISLLRALRACINQIDEQESPANQ